VVKKVCCGRNESEGTNAKEERDGESRKRRTRKGEGGKENGREGGRERRSERRSTAVGIFARERARAGKRGENKLKAKLYSHKKMELFLDAVPPRYEEKEG